MKKWNKYWRSPKRKTTISLSLLLAHSLIIVSYAFFIHTHVLNDGTRIVHAHPFVQDQSETTNNNENKEDGNQHEHTIFTYNILNLNNLFKENKASFFFFSQILFFSGIVENKIFIAKPVLFNFGLRAPPFLLS